MVKKETLYDTTLSNEQQTLAAVVALQCLKKAKESSERVHSS